MKTPAIFPAYFPLQPLAALVFFVHASAGAASDEPAARCAPTGASPPKPWTRNVPPSFPPTGVETRATVTLRFVVDHEGSVRDAAVLDSREPFASAALNAVKDWR